MKALTKQGIQYFETMIKLKNYQIEHKLKISKRKFVE